MATIDSSIPPISLAYGLSEISTSSQQIASGKRINSAKDDVAAQAIATQMSAEIISQGQAVRNINDGISMTEVADASLTQSTAVTLRMQELAQQAANETLSQDQRSLLQQEFSQLQDGIREIHQNSVFGDNRLLAESGTTQIQTGSTPDDRIPVVRKDLNEALTQSDFFSINIATPEAAANALDTVKQANQLITTTRTEFGATQNQFEVRANSIENSRLETIQARSRITDADIAMATATRTRELILNHTELAMQGQSNIATVSALQLLGLE